MTADEAIEAFRARRALPHPSAEDVAERAAIALEDQPAREFRVALERGVPRLFVRVAELDRVAWSPEPRRTEGWRSGYVHELRDVDDVVVRARAAVASARKEAA